MDGSVDTLTKTAGNSSLDFIFIVYIICWGLIKKDTFLTKTLNNQSDQSPQPLCWTTARDIPPLWLPGTSTCQRVSFSCNCQWTVQPTFYTYGELCELNYNTFPHHCIGLRHFELEICCEKWMFRFFSPCPLRCCWCLPSLNEVQSVLNFAVEMHSLRLSVGLLISKDTLMLNINK